MNLLKFLLLFSFFLSPLKSFCQNSPQTIQILILNEKKQPFENANVELLHVFGSKRVSSTKSNAKGIAIFHMPRAGSYQFKITAVGFADYFSRAFKAPFQDKTLTFTIIALIKSLHEIKVKAKPLQLQFLKGKTVVDVDESITNAGLSLLEVLEKTPGVVVDKNGGISLMGKSSILILVDEKPTYLSGADLNSLLSSMNSAQVSQIELITNPPAKYDANGNGGIINIKTKKSKTEGFNGSLSAAIGWSRDYKTANTLLLNYRKSKINVFASLTYNRLNTFTDIYADRKYFDQTWAIRNTLEQSTGISYLTDSKIFKTGIDWFLTKNTTIGFSVGGNLTRRLSESNAVADWKKVNGTVDSSINTTSYSDYHFKNGTLSLNVSHDFSKEQHISVDLDALKYNMKNMQVFNSMLLTTNGYNQGTDVNLPSSISIFSAKIDHSLHLTNNTKLESGIKFSNINTDNDAGYVNFNSSMRTTDVNRSNHFIYNEDIKAVYSSLEHKSGKISAQIGLRYEHTRYDANQLGNTARPDSSFSRNYSSFFPSGYLSYQADSIHAFTLTAGRRIDRPAYQKLNPFVFILNKYALQKGNPYMLPQYSWNFELSHRFKQFITTTFSYSYIKDYFSQLFLSEGTDILIYTDGNVGSMRNLGLSASVQYSPLSWWSFNGQLVYNYKKLQGYQHIDYRSSANQLQVAMNNQLNVHKKLKAEISVYYITKSRNDLQELLYPTGQLSLGLSHPVIRGRGILKLNVRDVLYTQAMEGITDFPQAQEYFKLQRDSRTFIISFSYRFGKQLKNVLHLPGSAEEEIKRTGS